MIYQFATTMTMYSFSIAGVAERATGERIFLRTLAAANAEDAQFMLVNVLTVDTK